MIITAAVGHVEDRSKFFIEQLELDEPRDDEILVRTVGVGVCNTDVNMLKSMSLPRSPMVFGHEGSGIVEKVGNKVRNIKPGDKVVASFDSCCTCSACRTGRPICCKDTQLLNYSGKRRDGSFTMHDLNGNNVYANYIGHSSFATYFLAKESNLIPVDDGAPLELLGPFGCGIMTGAGTVVNSLGCKPGSTIAIYGAGTLGLSAVMAAKIVGCTKIIVVDIQPSRLDLALELGATHVINSDKSNPQQEIMRITHTGTDYAINTTGNMSVVRTAFESTNISKGELASIAMSSGNTLELKFESYAMGRRFRGALFGDAVPQVFIPTLIEWYKLGLLPVDKLVKYYALEDINQAVEDIRLGTTYKPILRP